MQSAVMQQYVVSYYLRNG